MKFSLFAASLALVASVVASPLQVRNGCPNCLSKEAATTLVNRFIGVLDHAGSDLGDANATAQAILDNNYQEISDSILSLEGQPVSMSHQVLQPKLTMYSLEALPSRVNKNILEVF